MDSFCSGCFNFFGLFRISFIVTFGSCRFITEPVGSVIAIRLFWDKCLPGLSLRFVSSKLSLMFLPSELIKGGRKFKLLPMTLTLGLVSCFVKLKNET